MPRWAKLISLAVLLVVAVIGASGFILSALVSGSAKDTLLAQLSERAGTKIEVESVAFDVAAWYRLRPAVALNGVRIANPPGYRGESLLTAGAIQTAVALKPLFSHRIEVHALTLESPKFFVETAKSGITNLEAFVQALSSNKPASGAGGESGSAPAAFSIQRLELRNGEIHRDGTPALRGMNLALDDFAPATPSRIDFSTQLFGGNASRASLQGTAGPFSASAVPVDGRLTLTLAPAEIPAAVRKRQFGELIADPAPSARIAVDAAVKGDLYTQFAGTAKIAIAGIQIGPDPAQRLPLDGEAPAAITVRKPLSTPVVQINIRDARMKLGSGTWKGGMQLISAGGIVRGSSTGSISGIDINEFLTSFASSPNKLKGKLDVPSYTLRFAGKDGAQIKQSLSGEGRVAIAEGQVRFLDLLASIQRAIEGKAKEASAAGNTNFTTLTTDLRIADQKLLFQNLALAGPMLNLQGEGTVGFDQSIGMQLRTVVTGRIAELLGRRGTADRPAEAPLPVQVVQTIANPSVRPDLGKIAVGAATSYLEQLLRKRLDKQPK